MTRRSNYGTWPLFHDNPEPTHLNNRQPLGMKTPYVESLTSYFTGLSWSHCLSPGRLFASVIAPLLDKTYLAKSDNRATWLSRSFRARSAAINGTGLMALDWTTLLEQLTGREDLRYLTFLPWAGMLSQRHLLRRWRAWCSVCIQEWATAGQPLYEPLLWSVKLVTRCVIHGVPLTLQCPSCSAALHCLSHRGRPGYCDACGHWLGVSIQPCRLLSTHSVDLEVYHATMVGELLANSCFVESSVHRTLSGAMASLIEGATDNNASQFASLVGRNKSTISGWLHGSRMPLNELLDLSSRLKATPLKILSGSCGTLVADNSDYQIPKRKPHTLARKHFNRKKALARLEKSLTCAPPPRSMRHLAETLHVDKRVLYRHFPQLCKEIAAQAAAYRRGKVA